MKRSRSKVKFFISHFVFRRQRTDFFFSQKNHLMKADQYNKILYAKDFRSYSVGRYALKFSNFTR